MKKSITFTYTLFRESAADIYPEILGQFKPNDSIEKIKESVKAGEFTIEEIMKLIKGYDMFGKDGKTYSLRMA